ncbi:MAG: sigma-70 family RNA polymerase sigma factor [Planctomycetes bacterium]|nr:sigma-70 family RNA polymerase sigma factor [Planctomycetota bacterium]
MTPPTSTPDAWFDELAWTRRLARSLVRDGAAADDLAQDAWVAALQAPERVECSRGWFGGVLRNLARQARRAHDRREARERAASASEATEPVDELVARAELQQRLVAAVLALEEPYRSTVLRRHFAGHATRRIAEELGVPPATVESRLTRAHALLRARLQRELGGAWSLALLLRFSGGDGAAWPWLGLALMKTKLLVAMAVLVAAGGWWFATREPARSDDGLAPTAAPSSALAPAPGGRGGDAGETLAAELARDERSAVGGGASASASKPAATVAASAVYELVGRVLDDQGRAVAGVELALDGALEPRATSGDDGTFVVRSDAKNGRVRADDERWAAVRAGVWQNHSQHEPLVIVAPPVAVAGRVVSSDGEPLEHARVSYRLPADFETRFETVLEGSELPGWSETSARDGRFAFERVPAVAGATLRAVLDGYAPASVDVPLAGGAAFTLTLERPQVALAGALRGRVVDGEGRAVAGARVACGLTSTASGEDGGFELDLSRAVTADAVTAAKAGLLPDRVERPGERWPASVTLRLARPNLSLAGVVVDAQGEPLEGVKVWLADPTPFGVVGAFPAPLEGLLAGAEIPAHAFEPQAPDEDGDSFNDFWMRAGPPSAFWHWVATDDEGRFRLDGLLDRDYRLCALSDDPLALATSEPLAAGRDDVRVTLPLGERWAKFRGRVLDDFGAPLAGVRVRERMNVVDTTGRVYGGRVQLVLYQQGQRVETDDDGWFELEDVPKRGVALDFQGDLVLPQSAELGPGDEPERWSIVVHSRCNLQVELAPPLDRGNRVQALDGEGRPLDLLVIRGGSVNAYTEIEVIDGRTAVFSVSSEARTLVLFSGDVEVARAPLALTTEHVTTVAF